MALQEGCRRLRKAGKILFFTGVSLLTLGGVAMIIGFGAEIQPMQGISSILFGAAFFAGFWGIALWFLGWVIEGFARPSAKESD